jgi:hypothetical protein
MKRGASPGEKLAIVGLDLLVQNNFVTAAA